MIRRIASLVLVLVLAAGAAAKDRMAVFHVPDEVKEEVRLPRLDAAGPRPTAGDTFEAALVPRDGIVKAYLALEARNWEETRNELFQVAESHRDETSRMKPGLAPVVLYADRDVAWREVQWFLLSGAHPDVRLYRFYFAVETPDGEAYLPVFLPTDLGLPGSAKFINLRVRRAKGEETSRYGFGEETLGNGDEGRVALAKALPGRLKDNPAVEIEADAAVPFEEVVRLIAMLRGAGADPITFVATAGSPPRPPVVWKLPDDVREAVRLPKAAHAVVPPEEETPYLEIGVDVKGASLYASGEPCDEEKLKDVLGHASNKHHEFTGEFVVSKVPVTVVADAGTPWKDVRKLLEICSYPAIGVHKVHFAVRDGDAEKVLPAWLPVDDPPDGVAFLAVHLAGGGTAPATVTLRDSPLGEDHAGVAALAKVLDGLRKGHPDRTICGQLFIGEDVPYGIVVGAVDALRGIDVTRLQFLSE